jgi:lipid-binding SYLF domain-containing protein
MTTNRRFQKMLFLALLFSTVALLPGWSQNKQKKILYGAAEVMEEIREIPEADIPPSLLNKAEGLIIVPSVTKVSFVVGGRRGRGIALAKDENDNWTNPVFVTLTGGSVGFQIGVQNTDVILVFKRRNTLLDMQKGKFTLGADASVAAGPVGRSASAATDIEFKAEVLSYSRSRGLFAGVSLDGSSLDVWEEGNREYYREFDLTPQQIFANRMGTDREELKALAEALRNAEENR